MSERIKEWVESGRFEKQAQGVFNRIEKPIIIFIAFAAGYFTFAVVRIFQG